MCRVDVLYTGQNFTSHAVNCELSHDSVTFDSESSALDLSFDASLLVEVQDQELNTYKYKGPSER